MRIAAASVSAVLLLAVGFVSVGRGESDVPDEVKQDEKKLRAVGLSAEGPVLVEFFRQRARQDSDLAGLAEAIKHLADPDPAVRVRATQALVGRGAAALPALRRALNELTDPEVAGRARRCLQVIEGEGTAAVPAAAARLLALRKPAGAVEALLAYLPTADNSSVVDEVAAALAALAWTEGKPCPALLQALEDPVPLRRAAAGAALGRKDQPAVRQTVRKLLRDAEPVVRLRVALALVEAEDTEAVPVLIDLLAEVGPPWDRPIEELLQRLAGDWAPNPPAGDDAITRRIRRDAWASWWRNTDGSALLAAFRRRTLSPAQEQQVTALIEKLGHESFEVRQRAGAELIEVGVLALPLLREAVRGTDLERARRAEECLREIAERGGKSLPGAAARLLALRRPPGALETLLDFLPFADNEGMSAEAHKALANLAVRDGRLEPALTRALEDRMPLRRVAAAEAILESAALEQRAAVRKLMWDADQRVRLRVALALAYKRDRSAIPVLIDSLAEEPSEWTGEVEGLLYHLAGDNPPKLESAEGTAGRRKQRDSWVGWWKEAGSKIDLMVLDQPPRPLGLTLLVEGSDNGKVLELDREGKQRWLIAGLQFPMDAQVLLGNRVLIAEYRANRVTERDFKGNILWHKDGLEGNPMNVQRLANGNTFIATTTELLEVDRSGRTVWSHSYQGLQGAYRSRDGTNWCLDRFGRCVQLSAAGKVLKTFQSGRNQNYLGGIDVAVNGRLLIAQPNANQVVEMDTSGKILWQARAPGISTASHLTNGHVLVANYENNQVTELDRTGKIVWEHRAGMQVYRARRR